MFIIATLYGPLLGDRHCVKYFVFTIVIKLHQEACKLFTISKPLLQMRNL